MILPCSVCCLLGFLRNSLFFFLFVLVSVIATQSQVHNYFFSLLKNLMNNVSCRNVFFNFYAIEKNDLIIKTKIRSLSFHV